MQNLPPEPAPLRPWATLVVKNGVSLGCLARPQQQQALVVVWAALPHGTPPGSPCSERQLNQQLKDVLAGAAAWLHTDHVELRRWLVDAGWLQRDGFGREYRVTAADRLTPELHAVAAPLLGLDVAAWVAAQRSTRSAARDAKRQAWAQSQSQSRSQSQLGQGAA